MKRIQIILFSVILLALFLNFPKITFSATQQGLDALESQSAPPNTQQGLDKLESQSSSPNTQQGLDKLESQSAPAPGSGEDWWTGMPNPSTGSGSGGGNSSWSGGGSSGGSGGGIVPKSTYGLPTGSPYAIIELILKWLLGIFGILGIIGFVISGIMYLISIGNSEMTEKAKRGMVYSIIGIIVGLAGYIIIQSVNYFLNG